MSERKEQKILSWVRQIMSECYDTGGRLLLEKDSSLATVLRMLDLFELGQETERENGVFNYFVVMILQSASVLVGGRRNFYVDNCVYKSEYLNIATETGYDACT
eukprot:scaffold78126_cov51-Attheya_sp.AAC.2